MAELTTQTAQANTTQPTNGPEQKPVENKAPVENAPTENSTQASQAAKPEANREQAQTIAAAPSQNNSTEQTAKEAPKAEPSTKQPDASAAKQQAAPSQKIGIGAGLALMATGIFTFFSDRSHPFLALGRKLIGMAAGLGGALLALTSMIGKSNPAAPQQAPIPQMAAA